MSVPVDSAFIEYPTNPTTFPFPLISTLNTTKIHLGLSPLTLMLLRLFCFLLPLMTVSPGSCLSVAIVGGGAAGLAACKAFKCRIPGATVHVYESSSSIGGVWNYASQSNGNSGRKKSNPMYANLRTNLPKELMSYRSHPWKTPTPSTPRASFVTHTETLSYLQSYAVAHNLTPHIKLNTRVSSVKLSAEGKVNVDGIAYDHCVIANGHYSLPSVPRSLLSSSEQFKGDIIHSIEYDEPSEEIFGDRVVLCVGGRASGSDIAREISTVARKVYISDSSGGGDQQVMEADGNVVPVARTGGFKNGDVVLEDGTVLSDVDSVIFCTGYDYDFPFLRGSNIPLEALPGERRVSPLYKQLWHADYPQISFLGLPHSVVPFPLFEIQGEAVAEQAAMEFGGLPGREERVREADRDSRGGGPKGPGRVQDTHYLGDHQWDYCLDIAGFAGVDVMDLVSTNKEMYDHSGGARKASKVGGKDDYRRLKYDRSESFKEWSVCVPEKEGLV